MKIIHVVGARPNFMKAAPVLAALAEYDSVAQELLHTGQHYDQNMSKIFFQQLGLPEPDRNLEVGSASHTVQVAEIMVRFEQFVGSSDSDLVLVYGDVNSTVAVALVCARVGIQVGHVEAGLRSFDRTMPEEINRILTDQISDLLFTPSADGDENLKREGVSEEKIYLVGNVMIDTLLRLLPKVENIDPLQRLELPAGPYGLVTLHRPSNVDNPDELKAIMNALLEISDELPLIFPVHPRTRSILSHLGTESDSKRVHFLEPLGYLDFLSLQKKATVVITDSGGIQEETTAMRVPCLTLRENTERPVTLEIGTNILVGNDMVRLKKEVDRILDGKGKTGTIPPLWDGAAGKRIAATIMKL